MRKICSLLSCFAVAVSAPALAQPDTQPAGSAAAASPPAQATIQAMTKALADPRRDADRARDAWRHPAETLEFFKLDPGMTVVDYIPGGGWYTRVLVPFLGETGRYIALNPDVSGADEQLQKYFGNLGASFPAKAAEWTGIPAERIAAYNTDGVPASLNGTVDRVLIFREMHNLKRNGLIARELPAIRALLKPAGLLGIEQHRAKANAPASYADGNKGYLREKDVIAMVEKHGFELVGKSEVNANPKDSADYPAGVWELPPSLRTKREELKAVGESDRMTLLFRKRP
jgi:predicted methyltransferase